MSEQFDWQTGEDDWDESVENKVLSGDPPTSRNWKRSFFAGIILIGFVMLTVTLLFPQIQKRAEVATNALTENLLATHSLLQESAFTGDMVLFELTLFPKGTWQEINRELLARQLFWNRSSLGLWLDFEQFSPEDMTQVAIEYAPDLQSAEVMSMLPYVTMGEDGVLTPIVLQKTAVYKQVESGWQYAPYPRGFWGEEVEINGRFLTITAPQRDAEISERLVDDLEQRIIDACALANLDCPSGFQVELDFQTEHTSNYVLNQEYEASTFFRSSNGHILQIDIPTPTLVGLPIDDVGYEALSQGYAAQVIARIIANLDYNCCYFRLDEQRPLASQLQTLGLSSPFPPNYHPQSQFAASLVPSPEQDIVIQCYQSAISTSTSIYRYNTLTTTWSEAYVAEDAHVAQLAPAMGHGYLILMSPSINDAPTQLQWFINGEPILIDVGQSWIYGADVFADWEEDSQDLVMVYHKSDADELEEYLIKVDLNSCKSAETCTFESLSHVPMFSPEKSYSMVRTIGAVKPWGSNDFWLGDASGQPIESMGRLGTPLWIDEQTILFSEVMDNSSLQTDLMKVTMSEGQIADRQQLLTSEKVKQFLHDEGIDGDFMISNFVFDRPLMDDVVHFYATELFNENSFPVGYLLEFDLESEQLNWMAPFAKMPIALDVRISPNGRFLQAIETDNESQTLHLLDLHSSELQSYDVSNVWSTIAWSPDGEWLTFTDDEYLHLIAPAKRVERKVYSAMDYCNTAVWVNRTDEE